jgi:arylsulfatase A-like enzyme
MAAGMTWPSIFGSSAEADGKRLNVVYILADDLGWRDLGCFGSSYYETPHIDALAREGMRFTNAYAACHVCSPTRASILTGKYPARLHLTQVVGQPGPSDRKLSPPNWKKALSADEVTLAEALRRGGYATAIAGKLHVGKGYQGFQEKLGPAHVGKSYFRKGVFSIIPTSVRPYLRVGRRTVVPASTCSDGAFQIKQKYC